MVSGIRKMTKNDVTAGLATGIAALRSSGQFLRESGVMGEAAQALSNLQELHSHISQADDWRQDMDAAIMIVNATSTLNNPGLARTNPEEFALAFGSLFAGAGQLCSHLPPPLNAYATFLKGAETFFLNMWRTMDPESSHTARGRAMQSAIAANERARHRGLPGRGWPAATRPGR